MPQDQELCQGISQVEIHGSVVTGESQGEIHDSVATGERQGRFRGRCMIQDSLRCRPEGQILTEESREFWPLY